LNASKSTTSKVRTWNMVLWTLLVIGTLTGWLLGKDPGQMDGIIMWGAIAIGIGEASNVGKRATFKKEAVDADAS